MKKIFIKKSLNDLINDQNKLLEQFIKQSEEKLLNENLIKRVYIEKPPNISEHSEHSEHSDEDFVFNDYEDIPFIPINKNGDVNLPSINIEKKELDTHSVTKLKQAMKKE